MLEGIGVWGPKPQNSQAPTNPHSNPPTNPTTNLNPHQLPNRTHPTAKAPKMLHPGSIEV